MVCNETNPYSRCALGCQSSIAKRDVTMQEGSKPYVMTQGPLRFLEEIDGYNNRKAEGK